MNNNHSYSDAQEIEGARVHLKELLRELVNMGRTIGRSEAEIKSVESAIEPNVDGLCDLALKGLERHSGPNWRSPTDKPPHLPRELHSGQCLLVMRGVGGKPIVNLGRVVLGHWRPEGGNGNFDDDVLGWMPAPDASSFATGD